VLCRPQAWAFERIDAEPAQQRPDRQRTHDEGQPARTADEAGEKARGEGIGTHRKTQIARQRPPAAVRDQRRQRRDGVEVALVLKGVAGR
jgi:hypothetical protein